MNARNLSMRWAFWTYPVLLLMTFSVSCTFPGHPRIYQTICEEFENLPLTTSLQSTNVVFEAPATIVVMHGVASAGLPPGDPPTSNPYKFIKVEQSLDIPDYTNKATVFLNGWHSMYFGDDDQCVLGLGTLVGKIRLEGKKLTWNALGILRDLDGKEGYSWAYRFTVIAWNAAALNVTVNHDDADNFCKTGTGISDNFYFAKNWSTTTALSSFTSFLQDPDFPSRAPVAILPRGFGFAWGGDAPEDHKLLQLAYNLDHSEKFVEYYKVYSKADQEVLVPPLTTPEPVSLANSGFVSWNTYSIFKDNARRRDYIFGEMVSALGGNDVGVLQPPFSILPHEDIGGGCTAQGAVSTRTEDFFIDNIPFEYAIPMLTGWELYYFCDDENVKEIGVWIDKWSYDKDPAAPTGSLRYTLTSALHDKDNDPGHFCNHKVTILGLRPTAGVIPGRQ